MKKFILLLLIALSILSCSPDKDVSTSQTYKGVELYKGATVFHYVRNDTTYYDHFEKEGYYICGYSLGEAGSSSAMPVSKTVIYPNYNASNYDYAVYYLGPSPSPVIVLAHSTKTNDYFMGSFNSDEKVLYTPSLNGDDRYYLTNRME